MLDTKTVMLRLDSARNHLLRIELFVAMITSSAAVGSLVAGCFGMNLNSGVEDTEGWFWGLTLTLLIGMVFFVGTVTNIVWRRGWLIT
jgi:Mg2+ and Co2+ transporter CorA